MPTRCDPANRPKSDFESGSGRPFPPWTDTPHCGQGSPCSLLRRPLGLPQGLGLPRVTAASQRGPTTTQAELLTIPMTWFRVSRASFLGFLRGFLIKPYPVPHTSNRGHVSTWITSPIETTPQHHMVSVGNHEMTQGRRYSCPHGRPDSRVRPGPAGHVPLSCSFNFLPVALLKAGLSTLTDPLC